MVAIRPVVIALVGSSEGARKDIVAVFRVPSTLNIVLWSCRLKQKEGLNSSRRCLKSLLSLATLSTASLFKSIPFAFTLV